jgi:hypothetical protein
MGFEIRLKIHLETKQLGGIVRILFAAFVAPHRQAKIDFRRRSERVGLAERNFVPAVQILMPVEFLVLADYNPTVRFVLTPAVPCGHSRLLKIPGSSRAAWGTPPFLRTICQLFREGQVINPESKGILTI